MRKTFLIAMIAASFIMVSCGGSKEAGTNSDGYIISSKAAMELLNSVEFTKDGLVSMIKSKDTLTKTEFEAMYLAYSKVGIDKVKLDLDDNPVADAIYEIQQKYKFPENATDIRIRLLYNESPQVRGRIVRTILTLFNNEQNDTVMKILDMEKNNFVSKCIIIHTSSYMNNPKITKFVFSRVDSKNAALREVCARTITDKNNIKIEGVKEIIFKYFNDRDLDIRNLTYARCGNLHDESVIPVLEKVLNNPDEKDSHEACLNGLYTMWYFGWYGIFTSKAAYDVHYKYYKKTPRTRSTPPWMTIDRLAYKDKKKYDEWKKKATYFKEAEWVAVMTEIAKDENAGSFARSNAVKVIGKLGTVNDLKVLKAYFKKLKDSSTKDNIMEELNKALGKLSD